METCLKGRLNDDKLVKELTNVAYVEYVKLVEQHPGILGDNLSELEPFSVGYLMGAVATINALKKSGKIA